MRIVIVSKAAMRPRQNPNPALAERAQHCIAPPAEPDNTSGPLAVSNSLSTKVLLAGRNAVTIEHQGVPYVLRATRSGKLILTK